MKCPKCGYLGFETTNRCRNCGYDFSLSPATDPELTLQTGSTSVEATSDFELPAMSPATEWPAAGSFDLDRLFGEPAPPAGVVTGPDGGATGRSDPRDAAGAS